MFFGKDMFLVEYISLVRFQERFHQMEPGIGHVSSLSAHVSTNTSYLHDSIEFPHCGELAISISRVV